MTKWLLLVAVLSACTTATSEPKSNTSQRDEPAAKTRKQSFTDAEYAEHVRVLRQALKRHGLGHLNVRIEDPFVVVGDGTMAQLERSSQTVRWAADMLERDFFAKRPQRIIDIYLFRTAESYENHTKTLTGESPSTPYGFYSSTHRAMFMNIATGGGTLVHEIVHPYVEADFPNAPAWLNEGLGSLFEQSAERDGHIVGLTNWRLAGLQRALARGGVPSFETLAKLTQRQFYGDDSGTNYAQSRYLLYYLQERGLLRRFYRTFRANHAQDPSGYKTLTAILGESDMRGFQRRWAKYVSELRFP